MIQQLLSKYRNWIGTYQVSNSGELNQAKDLFVYRYYGDLVMRFLLIGWLIFQTYTFHLVSQRPNELFEPINWFDHLFMPVQPHWIIWYLVVIGLLIANFRLIKNGELKIERYILALGILWVNGIRWKYEFFSHVGHLMVLYHLVGVFLPRKKDEETGKELIDYSKAIQWFFGGLLVGYTMSGLWKIVGFFYKVILKPDHITWFHADAMKLNASVGFRDWDEQMGGMVDWYDILWPWQVLFVIMLLLQLFSVVGAIRYQILPYIMLGNVMFHLANALLIRIEFYTTPLVLFVALFPYHLIFRPKKRKYKEEVDSNGVLIRTYETGDKDVFSGFYAFREKRYAKNPLVWGVLYFPGVSLLAYPIFNFRRK